MRPGGTLMLILVAGAACFGAYHLLLRSPAKQDAKSGLVGAARLEHEAIDRQLENVRGLLGTTHDAEAMRALVARSGLEPTPEQTAQLLPLLRGHLATLRRNLEDARAALAARTPDADRRIFHARAAQEHTRFLAALSAILGRDGAVTLFQAVPSMVPPLPGSIGPGAATPDGRGPDPDK